MTPALVDRESADDLRDVSLRHDFKPPVRLISSCSLAEGLKKKVVWSSNLRGTSEFGGVLKTYTDSSHGAQRRGRPEAGNDGIIEGSVTSLNLILLH